jgi:hypothetical protein
MKEWWTCREGDIPSTLTPNWHWVICESASWTNFCSASCSSHKFCSWHVFCCNLLLVAEVIHSQAGYEEYYVVCKLWNLAVDCNTSGFSHILWLHLLYIGRIYISGDNRIADDERGRTGPFTMGGHCIGHQVSLWVEHIEQPGPWATLLMVLAFSAPNMPGLVLILTSSLIIFDSTLCSFSGFSTF